MADIRETALKILNEVKDKLPLGTVSNPDLFAAYTNGARQKSLDDNWAGGGYKTYCNEFVGWYSQELGKRLGVSSISLANFSVEGWLAANNKHHAWVAGKTGHMPLPGDVYKPLGMHMGVAYSCDDSKFISIDAGQGGPAAKQDWLKVVDRPFVLNNFSGWVDIVSLFTAAPIHPVPSWLPGWWQITVQREVGWYYFGSDFTVTKAPMKPPHPEHPPSGGTKIKYIIEFGTIVILSWPLKTGHYVVEKMTPPIILTTVDTMEGNRDSALNLTAKKM